MAALQPLRHTVVHLTNFTAEGLLTADETAEKIRHLSAKRIHELACLGYLPHYKIDKGEPLYSLAEVRKWVKENLIEKFDGINIPNRITLFHNGAEIKVPPPACISQLPNIREATIEMMSACVYFLCLANKVVYVGQSVSLATRLQTHLEQKNFDRVYVLPTPKDELNNVEAALIHLLQPELNKTLMHLEQQKKSAPPMTKSIEEVAWQLGFELGKANERAA